MSTAVLEGVRLAYDVEGTGEPLLMIQGLGYGRRGWGPAPALLARRFQVVTPDNRGFGDSDVPRLSGVTTWNRRASSAGAGPQPRRP